MTHHRVGSNHAACGPVRINREAVRVPVVVPHHVDEEAVGSNVQTDAALQQDVQRRERADVNFVGKSVAQGFVPYSHGWGKSHKHITIAHTQPLFKIQAIPHLSRRSGWHPRGTTC